MPSSSSKTSSTSEHTGVAAGNAASPKRAAHHVWIDGKLQLKSDAAISVYDHGLLYGDGVFEGIRAYDGRIFKMGQHIERLYESAQGIRLEIPFAPTELAQAIRDTVEANGLRDAYIRLVATRGMGTLGLDPRKCPRASVFCIADTIQLYPAEFYERGMKIIVAKRPRVPIACLDPSIKSLNYLNNILAKLEAIDADVLEAIMLNMDGWVAECTGDNIFGIKYGGKGEKTIITPPSSAGILLGITRRFVIEVLAPKLGFTVQEKLFKMPELLACDEVFLTGSAAEIIGVSHIDEHPIGDGVVGSATNALIASFRASVDRNAPED